MNVKVIIFIVITAVAMVGFAQFSFSKEPCKDTYENFGKAFMTKYCTKCHSSTKSNVFSRKGAPKGYDFDTVEKIKANKDDAIKHVIVKSDMPPRGDKPTDEEKAKLKSWLDCEFSE